MNVLEVYNHKDYQLALKNAIAPIKGIENREDAESCAIVAILEQNPITLEDCIACMKRAIDRFRHVQRKITSHETSINELFE